MTSPLPLTDLRVLVAEDDAANLEVVSQMLARLGATVATARNGVTALERIRSDQPDIVLLDIEMPEMSGLDVLGALRDAPQRPTMICLTAHVEPDYVERVYELGADGAIGKPLRSIEMLGRRVLEIHSGRMQPDDVPVLDDAVFDVLAEAMGPTVLVQLATQLNADLNRCDVALVQAIEQGALDKVRTQTHILTGVAGSVGASRLAVLSAQLNAAAHGTDDVTLRSLTPQLRVEIDALMHALMVRSP